MGKLFFNRICSLYIGVCPFAFEYDTMYYDCYITSLKIGFIMITWEH